MNKFLFLGILFLSVIVNASEYMPYPEAKITREQFDTYYKEIKINFHKSEKVYSEFNLATYSDSETKMSFAFTLEGHPAHPSWITRQVVFNGESLDMQQIGYFAGDEKAFAVLFQQYARLTEQTRKKFQK